LSLDIVAVSHFYICNKNNINEQFIQPVFFLLLCIALKVAAVLIAILLQLLGVLPPSPQSPNGF